jgi:signal transduction histidine kinase/ligand-binding sensor domain-containing protein
MAKLAFRRLVSLRSLACWWLLASPLLALDQGKHLTQYMHTSWRIQDGSAPSGIWSISQTSDGFLWLSAIAGSTYRFDGVGFVPWRLTGDGSPVNSINVSGDHRAGLWALGEREVFHLKGRVSTSHLALDGLRGLQISSEDADGSLWVVRSSNSISDNALCHVTEGAVKCLGKREGIQISPLDSLLADGHGGFWLGGQTDLVHWHGGVSDVYPIEALRSNAGQFGIGALTLGPDGSLWVGIQAEGRGMGLGRLMGRTVKPFITPTFDGSRVVVDSMIFDRDGNLWVATAGKGVYRIRGDVVEHYAHTEGLSGDSVWSLFEDREGIVWAGTTNGLDSFRDPRVTTFSSLQGLGKDVAVGLLASKDGSIWVANAESLDHIVNGVVTSIRTGSGLPGHQVTSLLEDRSGNLWVGVDNELYLFKDGRFRRFSETAGQPLGMVVGLAEDTNRNIWAECLGKPRKLVRIRDFKIKEEFPAPQVPAGRFLAADPHEGIWISTSKGEVTRFRNGVLEEKWDPGGDPSLRQIYAEQDGSVLAGSDNGLVEWRHGKVQRLTNKNGLPCNGILSFVRDAQKRLWLYTRCGVVELVDSDVQRWQANPDAVLQPRVFDMFDGAQPHRTSFNPAAYSSDGRIWFANGFVVQMIDPSRLAQKAIPAMTYIESITVDRKEFPATQGLQLAPHPRDVRIDYTSPTLLVPQKVLFRYRLDNYDNDWQDAGMRRQAFYTDLPPGNYSFRVMACNSEGVWYENAAKLDFSVAPVYYQMTWFRALCAVLLLACLWVAYQLRVRQLRDRFAVAIDARVAERTRIARELHDTLLQSAHGVLLRFETVSQLFHASPIEAKRQLDDAIRQTANFITEARDEVQGLRDSTAEDNDLAMEISKLGEALASQSADSVPPAFHVTEQGEARNLRPVLRDEVYKICAEALRNAFLHSKGRNVEVEIRYDPDQFRLRVRDDGIGIDRTVIDGRPEEGHYGLQGMRERATLIGGKLVIWSKVDAGAEVELRVPAAYAASRRRWWLPPTIKL